MSLSDAEDALHDVPIPPAAPAQKKEDGYQITTYRSFNFPETDVREIKACAFLLNVARREAEDPETNPERDYMLKEAEYMKIIQNLETILKCAGGNEAKVEALQKDKTIRDAIAGILTGSKLPAADKFYGGIEVRFITSSTFQLQSVLTTTNSYDSHT